MSSVYVTRNDIENSRNCAEMVDQFSFRSRLELILVFISFFDNIFSFYSFIVLKIILILILLTVNRNQ